MALVPPAAMRMDEAEARARLAKLRSEFVDDGDHAAAQTLDMLLIKESATVAYRIIFGGDTESLERVRHRPPFRPEVVAPAGSRALPGARRPRGNRRMEDG